MKRIRIGAKLAAACCALALVAVASFAVDLDRIQDESYVELTTIGRRAPLGPGSETVTSSFTRWAETLAGTRSARSARARSGRRIRTAAPAGV